MDSAFREKKNKDSFSSLMGWFCFINNNNLESSTEGSSELWTAFCSYLHNKTAYSK